MLNTKHSQRDAALSGPIDLKEVGSAEWAWQKLYALKLRWQQVEDDHKLVEDITAELQRYRVWEKIPPDKPYGSWDALLRHELGVAQRDFDSKVAEVKARAEMAQPLEPQGRPKKTLSYNVLSTEQLGTSVTYLTRRIARDHPAILERMKAGEYKSVRQAALDAGIVRPQITVPLETKAAARILKKHFPGQLLIELIQALVTKE